MFCFLIQQEKGGNANLISAHYLIDLENILKGEVIHILQVSKFEKKDK